MPALGDVGDGAFEFVRHVQGQFGRDVGVVVGDDAVFGHLDFAQDVEFGRGAFDVGVKGGQRGQGGGESRRQDQAADFFGLLTAEEVQKGDAA